MQDAAKFLEESMDAWIVAEFPILVQMCVLVLDLRGMGNKPLAEPVDGRAFGNVDGTIKSAGKMVLDHDEAGFTIEEWRQLLHFDAADGVGPHERAALPLRRSCGVCWQGAKGLGVPGCQRDNSSCSHHLKDFANVALTVRKVSAKLFAVVGRQSRRHIHVNLLIPLSQCLLLCFLSPLPQTNHPRTMTAPSETCPKKRKKMLLLLTEQKRPKGRRKRPPATKKKQQLLILWKIWTRP
jgi:hypothetical protein